MAAAWRAAFDATSAAIVANYPRPSDQAPASFRVDSGAGMAVDGPQGDSVHGSEKG